MIRFSDTVLITDNARMAASISSKFNGISTYFTVLEGPRLKRPDYENEVIRLANVIGRLRPRMLIYAKQPKKASKLLSEYIDTPFTHVETFDELKRLNIDAKAWRHTKTHDLSTQLNKQEGSSKLAVVCEYQSGVAPIIAANYANAHGADFYLIDTPDDFEKEVIHHLNNVSSTPSYNRDIREIEVTELTSKISAYLPDNLSLNRYDKVLFVTAGVPYGLAMPEDNVVYADNINIGHHIAHNLFDYQLSKLDKRGVTGLFVANRDLHTDLENEYMADSLLKAKGLSKTVYGNDTKLTELEITTLPYDLLYIATHGNQIEGKENTYSFRDENGGRHKIVTKEGIGEASRVVFIESIDGNVKDSESWTEQDSEIWGEFARKHIMTKNMPEPLFSKSTMLRMRELVLGEEVGMKSPISFDRIASGQRPLVIGNACGSWTDLSRRFIYSGATTYIGTLWPVTNKTAQEFAEKFFSELFEANLLDAFVDAKNSLTDNLDKLSYSISGTFESKHDPGAEYSKNAYEEVMYRLRRNLAQTKKRIIEHKKMDVSEDIRQGALVDEVFYKNEISNLKNVYMQANEE